MKHHDRTEGYGGYIYLECDAGPQYRPHDKSLDEMMERSIYSQEPGWIMQQRKTKAYNVWCCEGLAFIHGRDMDAFIEDEA